MNPSQYTLARAAFLAHTERGQEIPGREPEPERDANRRFDALDYSQQRRWLRVAEAVADALAAVAGGR